MHTHTNPCPQSTWNPPDTAPLDEVILGDFGLPWPMMCRWSQATKRWVVAAFHMSYYQLNQESDILEDPYFETDHEAPSALKGWVKINLKKMNGTNLAMSNNAEG